MSSRQSPETPAITPAKAAAAGFWPLTVPYNPGLSKHLRWMQAVINDQHRAGTRVLLVLSHFGTGIEVWRDGIQLTDKGSRQQMAAIKAALL